MNLLQPKAWQVMLLTACVAVAGWVVLSVAVGDGAMLLQVPTATVAVLVVMTLVLVLLGRPVRRWTRGDRTRRLDPLHAARVAALAVSAAWVGALVGGWYAAQALVVLPLLEGTRLSTFGRATGAAAASLVLSAAGLMVRTWCLLPPDDTGEGGTGGDPTS